MKDFILFAQTYPNTLITLREASYDRTNNAYLTNLSYLVYDFDKIKEQYVKEISQALTTCTISFRSNDALYIKNNTLIFIEFKNGNIASHLKKEEVRSKISESLLILTDILDAQLHEIRKDCYYILVYNRQNNPIFETQRNTPINQIGTYLARLSNTNHLINGFDRYRVFFHEVYTINESELERVLDTLP